MKMLKGLVFCGLLFPLCLYAAPKSDIQRNADNATIGHAILGTAIGAAAGAAVGGVVAGSPVIGGVVGGGLGLAIGSTYKQQNELYKYGINVVNLNGQVILLIPVSRVFETDSTDFQSSAEDLLNAVTEFLKKFPNENIHISSNTDPILNTTRQRELSLAQATKVAGYFWAHGVEQNRSNRRLTFYGNSANYQIATNANFSGMAKNRRIQITIYTPKESRFRKGSCRKCKGLK